jgi:steroid 5-alpha reductase family enzyme
MAHVRKFVLFWYDFIVGDDWVIAAGVVIALIASRLLADRDVNAWWVMPVAVVVMLGVSLWRETRHSRSTP